MKEILGMLGYNNIHFTTMPVFRWDGENIINQTPLYYNIAQSSNITTSNTRYNITYGVDNTQPMMEMLGATTSTATHIPYDNTFYPQNIVDEAYYTTIQIGSLGNDLAEIMAELGERTIVFLVDSNNNIQRDIFGYIRATYIDINNQNIVMVSDV